MSRPVLDTGRGAPAELVLIRHAPSLHGGALAGRRDVACALPGPARLARIAAFIGPVDRVVTSPARRCRETVAGLFPRAASTFDARLWEQDFGAWEGVGFADLPDLGPLGRADLAAHRPPGGESFLDVVARVGPSLSEIAALGGRSAIVAHAGVIRAALGLALGDPAAGLAFGIDPLSVTRITVLAGDAGQVIAQVNWSPDEADDGVGDGAGADGPPPQGRAG